MKGQISNLAQVAYARRMTVTDGAMQGLKIIDCDNGKIRFILNESRALDIMQVYHEGQNISFVSKNGFTDKSCEFIKRFEGGMLYTCGLDAIGGMDGYDIHGSFHLNNASVFHVECNDKEIIVEAYIYNTSLFGENLRMHRVIKSEICSNKIVLADTLENLGFIDQKYCLLYHVNVGYPLLDEGAKLVADIDKITPRNDWSNLRQNDHAVMSMPVDGEEETCYFLDLNKPEVELLNDRVGKKFTLSYSNDTLPCFVQWRSMASGDYAVGLEPCTSVLDDGFKYKTISAGQKIDFKLTLKIDKI
jgi:hypothetical protein